MRRVAVRKETDGFIPANSAEAVLTQLDQDIATSQIRVGKMGERTESEFEPSPRIWLSRDCLKMNIAPAGHNG